jgi:hypothetical protein
MRMMRDTHGDMERLRSEMGREDQRGIQQRVGGERPMGDWR